MNGTLSDIFAVIARSPELMLLVKATVVAALGLAVVQMSRSASASVRHLLLATTFGVLLTLPIAAVLAPSVHFEVPGSSATGAAPVADTIQATPVSDGTVVSRPSVSAGTFSGSTFSLAAGIWLAWGTGAALSLVSIVVAVCRLRRARRSGIPWLEARRSLGELAEAAGVRRAPEVLLHDAIAVPVTCGILRHVILLPTDARNWSELDLRRAFVHELEHIKRGDWPVHVLARGVCALYWFQPLVWIAWRQICLEAERACDDAVLAREERADYAQQLVGLARRLSNTLPPPVLSMANRSDLSRRVSAILDRNQKRGRIGMMSSFVTISLALATLFTIAPLLGVTRARIEEVSAAAAQKPEKSAKERSLDRAVVEAAEDGKISDLTSLLESGANINAVVDGDGTALIVAAKKGDKELVTVLLDRGADPNLASPGDGNPLIMAAREGHENLVALLLDRGAKIDTVVPGDENALIQASGAGHFGVVKLLVAQGADVNIRVQSKETNNELRTPLIMARKNSHTAIVNFLLAAGAKE